MSGKRSFAKMQGCGGRQTLCGCGDCHLCLPLSFAASPHSCLWDTELNGELTPFHVMRKSNLRVAFHCSVCNHRFRNCVRDIEEKEIGCSFCAGHKICGQPSCVTCFQHSFAGHPRSQNWSFQNAMQPTDVMLSSNLPILFDCDVCSHTFQMPPNFITRSVQAAWCPFCAGKRRCGNIDCQPCFDRSFAAHPRSAFWCHERNGGIMPRDKAIGSDEKFWFKCEGQHEWQARLYSIKSGKWCPACRNKTEKTVGDWLSTKFSVVREKSFTWTVSAKGGHCRFDFYLPDHNILIELDGSQHYRPWSRGDLETLQARDAFKATGAVRNGFTLIRVLQEDVEYERGDWRTRTYNLVNQLSLAPPTYCTLYCSSVTQFRRYTNNCFRTWMARQEQTHSSV